MKIKSIEISGFKSFVEKTVLNFPSCILGVVGPNGCGKSNVGDAIRWVLGEQAMRRLRGQSLDDLIFNGSATSPPLGMAEVSILFEVEPGELEGDYGTYSEIMVTRRLFRSGDTECFINNHPSRLRDIIELFQGTGLGARAYSMVEQGQIEHLVHARPEDRRILIEELAGVSRFKGRRLAAERKLERTRQNLLRIKDILGEVDRQAQSLQRQAKRAERYKRLREQVRELELQVASRRQAGLERLREEANRKREELEAKGTTLHASIVSLDNRLTSGRSSLMTKETELERARQQASDIEIESRDLEQQIALIRIKIQELHESFLRFEKEAQERSKRRIEIEEEIADLRRSLGEVDEELLREENHLDEREREAEAAGMAALQLESEIEKLKSDLVTILTEQAEARNRVSQSGKRLEELGTEQVKADELAKEGRSRIEALSDTLRKRSTEADEARAQFVKVQATREDALNSIQHLRGKQDAILARIGALRDEISDTRSRYNSLVDLQQKYEGFQEGVRSIMMRQARNGKGPYLVAEVMEADPSFERALAAALGEKLQYVIVQSHEEGLDAIRFLHAESAGRGTFIPAELMNCNGEIPNQPTNPLLEKVRVQEGFDGVAQILLGGVEVVPDVTTGLERWRQGARKEIHVTPEGEVIHPSGAISGGDGETIETKILSRKREIKELEGQLIGLDAIHAELALSKEQHEAQLKDKEALLPKLDEELQELRWRALAADKDSEKLREEVDRWADRLEVIAYEQALRAEEIASGQDSLCNARRALSNLAEQQQQVEQLRRDLERRHADGSQSLGEIQGSVVLLKIQVAKLRERKEQSQRTLDRLESIARELQAEEVARQHELVANHEEKERLEKRAKESNESLKKLQGDLETARGCVEALANDRLEVSSQIGLWEEDRSLKRSEFEKIEEAKSALQIEIAQNTMEVNHLRQEIWDRYGVPLEVAGDRQEEILTTDLAEVEQLKEQLRRIGDVNLESIADLEDLRNRQEFLSSQKEDLEKSVANLSRTASQLNREFRTRFLHTFQEVNQRLSEVFPKLFSGGQARLLLTDDDNVLESGVDVVAQPPGKKLQSIGLLSGGEKALTAMALIFSVFLIRPAPFILLDEVDAALDDANIDRFNQAVGEMGKQCQVILITHNKKTMELAGALYGVTMQEPGKSKIVSVSME